MIAETLPIDAKIFSALQRFLKVAKNSNFQLSAMKCALCMAYINDQISSRADKHLVAREEMFNFELQNLLLRRTSSLWKKRPNI